MITSLLIGGISGWIAGKFMKFEKSVIFNIILGIAGGYIGPTLLSIIGLHKSGIIGSIISATLGAVIIIYIGRLLFKK